MVTEVGAGPGGRALIGELGEHGYASVLAPEPPAPDYRTVLASRGPSLTPVLSGIGVLPHRGLAARLGLGGHVIGPWVIADPPDGVIVDEARMPLPS